MVTEQDHKISEAARSLEIGDNLLRRWTREFEGGMSIERLSADEREELMTYSYLCRSSRM